MENVKTLSTPQAQLQRALSLDALRGFAILTMVLSGVVPYGILPAWMYHVQVPPPEHVFDPSVPGISWVDLVFPFFLFAMGASFPLALTRRLKKGPLWKVLLGIVERGFLLGSFAIFLNHIRPYSINGNPTLGTWFQALLGFVLLFPMYARWPSSWNLSKSLSWGIRLAGWGAAIVYLVLFRNAEGEGFDPNRRDIIIVILTNVAVFGSLAWIVSRKNISLRLVIMAVLVAAKLSSGSGGWIGRCWSATLVPYYIHIGMISYLLIALPGSIAGDLLLKWIRTSEKTKRQAGAWSHGKLWGIAGLMIGFILVCLVGLQARWLLGCSLVCFALGFVGWAIMRSPQSETEQFIQRLFGWGMTWLVIGLFFEPYQEGIKKDPATFSYYFLTAGLAVFLLIAFLIIIDVLKKGRWCSILVANGQNPMIAYVAWANLILPLMNITKLGLVIDQITPGPWLGTLRGLLVTLLVALVVWPFSKKKLFWRT